MSELRKSELQQFCNGCSNNYYNLNRQGGCWMLRNAKKVQRTRVGTWQNPPYVWRPQDTLNCHDGGQGQHWILKNDPRIQDMRAT